MSNKKKVKGKVVKRIILFSVLFLVLLGIVGVGLYFFLQEADDNTGYLLEDNLSYYYQGFKFSFKKDLRLGFNDKGETVNLDDTKQQFPANPLYYPENKKILLPCTMGYFNIIQNKNTKIEALSTIECTENGNIYAEKDGVRKQVLTGFLYDGTNIYVFMEPVRLEFNGYSFDLSPMSYVEADPGIGIMVFNAGTTEMFFELPNTAVTAYCANGEYTVSLINGSMVMRDGSKRLLYSRPQDLDNFFE